MQRKDSRRLERGQVMSEYAIMLAIFTFICAVFLILMGAFMNQGWRILSLVAWESAYEETGNDYDY